MKHSCHVAIIVSVFLGPLALAQQPDAKALFRKSIQNYDQDWRLGMKWGYTQTDTTRNGDEKSVELSEVLPLEGTPYERLTAKNGRPLTDSEKRREAEKYEKALRQRQNESPAERQARIHKYESERAFLKDLPNAYDCALLGEDTVDSRSAWMISLTPRPDFVPATPHGAMLKHIQGKLWIDKQDVQWAKAEAHVIDTISIGWIVARIGPGAKITLDLTRVTDALWMPKRIDINGNAKVLMVHNKTLNEEITFAGYRKADGQQASQATKADNRPGQSFR